MILIKFKLEKITVLQCPFLVPKSKIFKSPDV